VTKRVWTDPWNAEFPSNFSHNEAERTTIQRDVFSISQQVNILVSKKSSEPALSLFMCHGRSVAKALRVPYTPLLPCGVIPPDTEPGCFRSGNVASLWLDLVLKDVA
jgi:hypothetical protein